MWMLFLFIMGVIGVVLISIFGNITTTNQQDYTLIKNTTEAAMNDAIDWASYRSGFLLCYNDDAKNKKDKDGRIEFTKDNYIILRKQYFGDDTEIGHGSYNNCDEIIGEYIINKDVFVESFLRRFAEDINNNKSYQVTVQDVIEFPPKVSIRIDTYNTYNSTQATTLDFTTGDFNIRNQIDAIFEEKD